MGAKLSSLVAWVFNMPQDNRTDMEKQSDAFMLGHLTGECVGCFAQRYRKTGQLGRFAVGRLIGTIMHRHSLLRRCIPHVKCQGLLDEIEEALK